MNGIKIHIAAYPWKEHILKRNVHDVHVNFWKQFSEKNKIEFITLYPDFINNDMSSEQSIEKYFIPGDVHWNEEGHKLIASKIMPLIQ